MFLLVLLALVGFGPAALSEKHYLFYIYTGVSHGSKEFTAMGFLDRKMIDYYDSRTKEKVPKQPWMKDNLPPQYWTQGSVSRQNKEQWFYVNMDILKQRMRQNGSETHFLQWQHGCVGEQQEPDGPIAFTKGFDMYNYDGDDFLYFDMGNKYWAAPQKEAMQTKEKWDHEDILKKYTVTYLEQDCINWMTDFLKYERKSLSVQTEVYVFGKEAKLSYNVELVCLASGFSSQNVVLEMRKDGRLLTVVDGLVSSNVRPIDGNTFQRRDSVEIPKSDMSEYTCRVAHRPSGLDIHKVWDRQVLRRGASILPYLALVGTGLLVVAIGILMWKLKLRPCGKCSNFKDSTGSAKVPDSRCSSLRALEDQTEVPLTQSDEGSKSSIDSGCAQSCSTDDKEPIPEA